MRVSCMQENLAKGLAIVGRAVATRSTLPVLSNILLATDQGRLKLSATNLEISITCWIGAKVEEDGSTTVPARTFVDLVNILPQERVDMELVQSDPIAERIEALERELEHLRQQVMENEGQSSKEPKKNA